MNRISNFIQKITQAADLSTHIKPLDTKTQTSASATFSKKDELAVKNLKDIKAKFINKAASKNERTLGKIFRNSHSSDSISESSKGKEKISRDPPIGNSEALNLARANASSRLDKSSYRLLFKNEANHLENVQSAIQKNKALMPEQSIKQRMDAAETSVKNILSLVDELKNSSLTSKQKQELSQELLKFANSPKYELYPSDVTHLRRTAAEIISTKVTPNNQDFADDLL